MLAFIFSKKIYKKVNMLKCYVSSYVMLCYVMLPPPLPHPLLEQMTYTNLNNV
jgi:hypothetical protein